MNTSKFLPIGFLALGLAVSGAAIATAQSTPTTTTTDQAPAATEQAHKVEGRMKMHGKMRGEHAHGRREGHRMGGPRMGGFGGRGHGGEMMRTMFKAVDADGDGAITQAEIDTYRAGKVTAADTSGDGALSIEEFDTIYREMTRSRMVNMFQDFDADGDGNISQAEMDDRFGDVVKRMDRNEDGALTLQDRGRK